jgi:phosphoglycolate phosphatase
MSQTIQELHAKGHRLFIVSANSQAPGSQFLDRQGLSSYFEAIEGGATFNKAAAISRLIKAYQLDPGQTWYVGDEAHDIVSAKRAGIQSMAVTWGYNNLERLSAKRPDRLIFTPAELRNNQ